MKNLSQKLITDNILYNKFIYYCNIAIHEYVKRT